MATTEKFIKLEQTIKAFNKETADNNPSAITLKQTLQSTWINTPLTVGQKPRTVKDALAALDHDQKLLQALGKYKTQKTDESTYLGKRAFKRVYVNSDDVREWNDTAGASPWACEWRLGSTKQDLNAGGIRVVEGDSQDKYLSTMALPLYDYEGTPDQHQYTKFENHFELVSINFPAGSQGWLNTSASRVNRMKFLKGGRYLITGNLQLRLFTKSQSEFRYDSLDNIVEIVEIDNPVQSTNVNEIQGSKADMYYPYARIKMIHTFIDPVTGKIEIKNVFYSGKVSMTPTGVNHRTISAGFSAMLKLEENDCVEFALERSHRTIKMNIGNPGSNKDVTDAICAQKKIDSSAFNPNRDFGNYFEITRISGLR